MDSRSSKTGDRPEFASPPPLWNNIPMDALKIISPSPPAALREQLLDWMRAQGSIVVAYSGGADSALALALALEALGDRAVAVTADSPSIPRAELEFASGLARRLGARHEVVASRELDNPEYTANRGDRCYYCKTELYRLCEDGRLRWGFAVVINGKNLDDLGDYRPGHAAAHEARVKSPFVELGLDKSMIREISRLMNLPTWDKPATPCLASRLAPGTVVTELRLGRIERLENMLWAEGFRVFRLRNHEELARLELGPEEQKRFLEDEALRERFTRAARAEGFRYVTLDLEGYRTGSMNPTG